MTDITFDIETNNLLNNESICYNSSPYKIKDTYKDHCRVIEIHSTGEIIAFYDGDKLLLDGRKFTTSDDKYTYKLEDYEPLEYTHYQMSEFKDYIKNIKDLNKVVGHNIINFDLLSCKLTDNMDYTVAGLGGESDTWIGKEVDFVDTLLLSKTLNADRAAHSLDKLAKMAGKEQKIEFRKHIPQKDRFNTFDAGMLLYCIQDVKANTAVFHYLEKERKQDAWNWDAAIRLEKKVAEIVCRSSHRGFKFDIELAEKCIHELDELMEERRQRVEPLLPPRPATKKFLKDHTPPASQILEKEITFPKKFINGNGTVSKTGQSWLDKWDAVYDEENNQIHVQGFTLNKDYDANGDGNYSYPPVAFTQKSVAAHIRNFVEKHGGSVNEEELSVELFGETMELPIEVKPLKTTMPMKIGDSTAIKSWIVEMGWNPTEYATTDITLKSNSKVRRTEEELDAAIEKYVTQTLESPFCTDRCAHLKARPTYLSLTSHLRERTAKYGCKVLNNPKFTIGQNKELCRDLERLAEKFPNVRDVVEYLTLAHRRNSILGGGMNWEEGEDADKGYMSHVRDDGRIPAEADTCGCATSRFKHKKVANIPRTSSLYGKKMRSLFATDRDKIMVGFDFKNLEARIEAHYTYAYDKSDNKDYCQSLVRPQPLDTHTLMSHEVARVTGQKDFTRQSAKAVRYACAYGAQAARLSQAMGSDLATGEKVFNTFWEVAKPLADLKEALTKWWKVKGKGRYIKTIDGRKIYTRSEHALLNSLFQSAGVICAKQTAVFLDKLYTENGLQIDFFKDDYLNSNYATNIILYHDEQILEETGANFKFKVFNSEEEALTYSRNDDKIDWSEVIKKNGKFYIGYSLSAQLIRQAVELTNEHFKLNMPLACDYSLGKTWMECH